MNLPKKFLDRMKKQLGEEFDDFLKAYDRTAIKGIRVNTLKISVDDFKKISPFKLRPVPWTVDGFYIESSEKPGKHPYYYAGLYYIQEPSAMLPAEVLSPTQDDIVLDLCAAPGGKTMQLAAKMKNKGLLIANDISSNRLRALIRNAELLGVKNLIVLNEHQDKIAISLKNSVDKLLIDAPCSGEGMFKKDDGAVDAYADYDIEACTSMQKSILDSILPIVNGGGSVVYSTCTFNEDENENMIQYILEDTSFELNKLSPDFGFVNGRLEGTLKIYPHLVEGEGHFVSKVTNNNRHSDQMIETSVNKPPELLLEFMSEYLTQPLEGYYKIIKERVFLMPEKRLKLSGVKIVKEGWYIGDLKKNRFEPSHAFALGLKSEQFKNTINFNIEDPNCIKYLKCETISCDGNKGYNLVCVNGFPLGWGKWANGKLKNLYPAAWRLL